MKTVILNGKKIPDRAALHAALAEELSFPQYYGRNLDALYDLLTEGSEQVRIVLLGKEAFEENLGVYFTRFLRVLEDAAQESAHLTFEFREEDEMDLTKAREKLDTLQKKMSAFNHASGLIFYDAVTGAPKGTAGNRAQTLSVLSLESYQLATGPETVELLEFLDGGKDALTSQEKRTVELLLKEIRRLQKIPQDEYLEMQMLLVEADDVWHRAKETSDFALFEPLLEKIFEITRRFAGYLAPEKAPYDYWLGEYEEGLTMERCDEFFATLRAHIVPLLRKIQKKPQISNEMLHGDFPEAQQEALSYRLMKLIGLDLDHVGLSTTEHPFTTSLGSHFDERITTHYYREDFSFSMYSVIHEGGHALYDTGSDDAFAYTALDGGVSMGIHESQSRFYENLLGRNRAFCERVFPLLEETFPEQMRCYTAEDLYRAVNRAEPSLIRTEADELTYCLHVMIRYELEKRVMAGELSVHDLPSEWNRLYKEYLGIDVPDDKSGVLQDSHWSGGAIGYFPSYALGSAYGAQLLAKMREQVDVEDCLRRGDFAPINEWNREHIWKYGCLYQPAELFRMAAGEEFDPKYFTDYLEKKYAELYGLE